MSIRNIYMFIFFILVLFLFISIFIIQVKKDNKLEEEINNNIINNSINESLINNVSEIIIETNDGQESFILTNNPEYLIQIKKNNNSNIIILTKRF